MLGTRFASPEYTIFNTSPCANAVAALQLKLAATPPAAYVAVQNAVPFLLSVSVAPPAAAVCAVPMQLFPLHPHTSIPPLAATGTTCVIGPVTAPESANTSVRAALHVSAKLPAVAAYVAVAALPVVLFASTADPMFTSCPLAFVPTSSALDGTLPPFTFATVGDG